MGWQGFFFFFHFYWGMVDLQGCHNFCCTTKWFNDTWTHTHVLSPLCPSVPLSLSWEVGSTDPGTWKRCRLFIAWDGQILSLTFMANWRWKNWCLQLPDTSFLCLVLRRAWLVILTVHFGFLFCHCHPCQARVFSVETVCAPALYFAFSAKRIECLHWIRGKWRKRAEQGEWWIAPSSFRGWHATVHRFWAKSSSLGSPGR